MINLKLTYKALQRFIQSIHCKMGVYVVISMLCLQLICAQKVGLDKTLVYGPGLEAHFVMPVRYFFIQVVDEDGRK